MLMDKLEDNKDACEDIVNRFFIRHMLDSLGEDEKKLIIWRYFQQKTQSQIARKLGVSQVQVSRMEKRILETMRNQR